MFIYLIVQNISNQSSSSASINIKYRRTTVHSQVHRATILFGLCKFNSKSLDCAKWENNLSQQRHKGTKCRTRMSNKTNSVPQILSQKVDMTFYSAVNSFQYISTLSLDEKDLIFITGRLFGGCSQNS